MTNTKKGFVSLVLALVMIFTLAITAFAVTDSDNQIMPRYTYVSGASAQLDMHTFSCDVTGNVTGIAGCNKTHVKLQLQKENDGVWSTVETWEKTSNTRSCTLGASKTVSPLSNYRLKATLTAYYGSDSETLTYYRYE